MANKSAQALVRRSNWRYANVWISAHPCPTLLIACLSTLLAFALHFEWLSTPPHHSPMHGYRRAVGPFFFGVISLYFFVRAMLGFRRKRGMKVSLGKAP